MTRRLVTLLTVLAAVAAAFAAPVAADPNNNNSQKLRAAVTLDGVRSHQQAFQAIADISGGNRFAGLPGHERSADYVADRLRAAGYDVSFQYFDYFSFFERSQAELSQTAPVPTTYGNGTDFRIMTFSGTGTVTAPVYVPSGDFRGCMASDFAGFPAGGIALVSRGAPRASPWPARSGSRRRTPRLPGRRRS